MFSTHLLLLQNEEPKCTIVCSSDVQSRVHVEATVVGSASVSAVPSRTRIAYPVTIQCSTVILGRPGGSVKGSFGLVQGTASIQVRAGAIRSSGTAQIVATASVVAAMVDVTFVGTASIITDLSEPYGFIVSRALVTAIPYAIHNATLISEGISGLGTYAEVEHIAAVDLLSALGDCSFAPEITTLAQVRMDGVARFRAIGTYTIDGTVRFNGVGDAVFQALLNFGGLLPSGAVRKSYLVEESLIRFTTPLKVGLALGATSRYLPTSLIEIGDDVLAMGPLRFPFIEEDQSDTVTFVQMGEEFRLDILAYRHYGTPALWWVIAAANGIRNPFTDPQVGALLRLPALDRIYREVVGRVA